MESQEVIAFLKHHNAWWYWDNHRHLALLTSGKVSDFFANCSPIFTDPIFQDRVGASLAPRFIEIDASYPENMWVIGSAMGAIGLAQSIARNRLCKAAYTEPVHGRMDLSRFDLGEKPYVILCEDVISTGGTTKKTITGILEKHPEAEFHKEISVIINRSNADRMTYDTDFGLQDFKIRSLVTVNPNVWNAIPESHKQCRAIRPKGHWKAMQEKF